MGDNFNLFYVQVPHFLLLTTGGYTCIFLLYGPFTHKAFSETFSSYKTAFVLLREFRRVLCWMFLLVVLRFQPVKDVLKVLVHPIDIVARGLDGLLDYPLAGAEAIGVGLLEILDLKEKLNS